MSDHDPAAAATRRYWRMNLLLMAVLLSIWAIVGLGCGILFADALNAYRLGGIPLGFWFAQQGSIAVFVVLVLVYAVVMNAMDRRYRPRKQVRREQGEAEVRREQGTVRGEQAEVRREQGTVRGEQP